MILAAAQHQPAASTVTALLLLGEFDPATTPSGADEVLRRLPNGRHVVIRTNGHTPGNAARCDGAMIGEFLDRASAHGTNPRCAADNPAPPFLLSRKDQ